MPQLFGSHSSREMNYSLFLFQMHKSSREHNTVYLVGVSENGMVWYTRV